MVGRSLVVLVAVAIALASAAVWAAPWPPDVPGVCEAWSTGQLDATPLTDDAAHLFAAMCVAGRAG